MAHTVAQRPYSVQTKEGTTGIFDEQNLEAAKVCERHLGRFVKVKLKSSGLKLERKIDFPFIRAVQRGQFEVLTYLE